MKPKIHLLDSLTANQIAAGEVIERPVSIVKELVENSIDAGSQRIHVEIRGGGLEWIRVTDQGSGITREDLLLSIQRHATSKLTVIDDLDSLATLGFRGEALASIASVANLQITSRTEDNPQGYQLQVKGEDVAPQITTVGCPIGTTVTVSDLFYNTPARLKFMKSAGYEGGLIHDLLIQMALGYPQIDFILDMQGKTVLNTAGISNLVDLTEVFYGKEARAALVTIAGPISQGNLTGFITAPPYSRGTRKGVHIFVNGRRIVSKEIQWSVDHGFEYLLPKGRFPVAILNFSIPGHLLDVNVHPGKMEIRINDRHLYHELTNLVRRAVSGGQIMPDYSSGQWLTENTAEVAEVGQNELPKNELQADMQKESSTSAPFRQVTFYNDSNPGPRQQFSPDTTWQEEKTAWQGEAAWQEAYKTDYDTASAPQLPRTSSEEFSFGPHTTYKIIGQLHRTFILAETEAGLMIIDQHVAHERVLYEKFLAENQTQTLPAQILLTPITVQLTALEEEILIKNIMILNDLGLIVERFGPRCYILRSAPPGQETIDEEFFKDFLDKLNISSAQDDITKARQALLIMMSCKAAIKANHPLSINEMETLIAQLQHTAHPMTCPHGRPIIYLLPYNRLLRAFGRSG